ncbi:MAG: hypothetical protein ACPH9N_08100, partial [Alteromonas sp.]
YSYIMNNPLAGTDPSGYVANMGNDSPVDKHKTMSLIHRLTALQEGQGNGSQSLGDVSSGSAYFGESGRSFRFYPATPISPFSSSLFLL